ncbi:uncharacterized protein PG986_002410 [Apiospora aurea]|uniref:Circumsporozoite protein n=1 Tax=Apiospora aurea TaxID=335848 RepID=A0ABR1QP06_9PEZI
MYTKTAALAILLAAAEARFGQEGAVQNAIQSLSSFGEPGQAGTFAGQTPSVLLAAADPCAKLELADKIVTSLGNDPEVLKGAAQLVQAEQNFNPFNVKVPNICDDVSLPATAELRGIIPLVDPDVDGAADENQKSATSLTTPFDAAGKSVADIMKANGFSNFAAKGAAAGGNAGNAGNNNNNSGNNNQNSGNGKATTTSATRSNGGASATATSSAASSATTSAAAKKGNNQNNNNQSNNSGNANNGTANAGGAASGGKGAVTNAVTGNFPGFQASSLGLDFGTCVPTVKFEESLNGRKAGESTFQAQDPAVNKGQNEALNPNIIFTRICDQLNNVCGAAKDAVTACKAAQAKLGKGPKDATTADAWNSELGFAGVSINPDNAPQQGLIGHT